MKSTAWFAAILALASGAAGFLQAQMLSGEALVKALRQGGYVIVMRHASSPRDVPDKQTANPDNTKPERQLDAEGRTTATEFGKALRELKIPVGEVLVSPTYRALETARLAKLSDPKPTPELGDNGRSMQGGTEAQAAWLRKEVMRFPSGKDTILVTHLPNIRGAFPQLEPAPADGETVVFGRDGKGGSTVVARIKIDEWPRLKP
jgi:phosphohistidine phosphatase SixA